MPRKSATVAIVSADTPSRRLSGGKNATRSKSKNKVTVTKFKRVPRDGVRIAIHNKILKPKLARTTDVPLLTKKLNTKSKSFVPPILTKNVSLALLSPFRFPIDNAHLASQVARYAGTAFIVIGAMFTIYNINAVSSYFNNELMEQVASTASSTDCVAGTADCTTTTSGSNIDTTPNADFNVEWTSGTALSGTVPVNVTVPLATSVVLTARSTDSSQTYKIGSLFRVSDLAWRTYWQTTAFLDGTYRLTAIITNDYGSYTVEDSQSYTILNYPIETTATTTDTSISDTDTTTVDSTTSSTTDTTTPVIAPATIDMTVKLGSTEPLSGSVSVRTFVDKASSVRLFLRPHNTTSSFTSIGYASFHGDTEWRYEWNTANVPNNSYDLRVQAVLQSGETVTRTIVTTIYNDAKTTETTLSNTAEEPVTTESLEPVIQLVVAEENPVSGGVDIFVTVPLAQYVELYSVQTNAITPHFIGLALKQSDTEWRYRLDSLQMPNGSYELFAKVRHAYGDSLSNRIPFVVKNEVKIEQTEEQTTYLDTLTRVNEEMEATTEPIASPSLLEDTNDEMHDQIQSALDLFDTEVKKLADAYAQAVRMGDIQKRDSIRAQMDALEDKIIATLSVDEKNEDIIQKIREYLTSINTDLREHIDRTETIIKDRVGDAVTKDSDKDGVSDYDEVSIYSTNPFNADSDGDGYTDGVEVLSGYNPTDSTPEVNIQYESPEDSGITREDLLTVTTVGAIAANTIENETPKRNAVFAGTGLPNSYVTLYIFSTPIIVTVKTDTQGNWSYIFDKELDDGEHEVYVGMTDNAGKIIAKSNPLAFIKTAEAFSPVGTEAATIVTEPKTPSLISEQMMLAVGSVAVVALGLVLLLLGIHARPREKILEPA